MGQQATPAPRTALAIVAEVVGALLMGLLMAALFGLLAGLLFQGAGLGMGLLVVQLWAAVVGLGFGGGVGAAIAGRLMGQRGSWWLGALAGAVTGFLTILLMRLLNVGGLQGLLVVGVALSLAAAVAGYNLRRGK